MRTSDFDYELPVERIAQTALEPRDHSKLMVINRKDGSLEHRHFYDIGEYLKSGDVLVCNDSRVIPARLFGRKVDGGAKVELLLLRRLEPNVWETLARPGRRLKAGMVVELGEGSNLEAQVIEKRDYGTVIVSISHEDALEKMGSVALPPYIHEPLVNPQRYQTVYAQEKGSVAAPTAGLHFTPELMLKLQRKGVGFVFSTLHLGLDSFRPVQVGDPTQHVIHKEYGVLTTEAAREMNQARAEGRRLICVGTSSVRLVEHTAREGDGVKPFSGWTDLFIYPGHRFKVVDAMITNFHLPRSTLLMLVSAFAGRELILRAYREAMNLNYRFYSFGDCMLIL